MPPLALADANSKVGQVTGSVRQEAHHTVWRRKSLEFRQSIGNDWKYIKSIDPEFVKVQNISRTGGPVLFMHVVVSSSGESALTQNFESETLTMLLPANDRGPHSCRVHGQLEAWMLLG